MKKNFLTIAFALAITFSTVLAAHSFTEPSSENPSSVTKSAPLNTGSVTQQKSSGLAVNLGFADIGFTVQGDAAHGFVDITSSGVKEKLYAIGNFLITGGIKPQGVSGSDNQVLAIAPSGTALEWSDKYAWLSLTAGIDRGPMCGNGTCDIAAGENCSNCADCACPSNLFCWQGTCVNAPASGGVPPPTGNPAPAGCGDGTLNLNTEQCELNTIYTCPVIPITVEAPQTCGAPPLKETHYVQQVCDMCRCVNPYIPNYPPTCPPTPPPPFPPLPGPGTGPGDDPQPPQSPPGGGCGITGGPFPISGGAPGQQGYMCGGACPDTPIGTPQVCKFDSAFQRYGTPACRCRPDPTPPPQPGTPGPGPGNNQNTNTTNQTLNTEEQSELLAKISGISGIKVAEASNHCSPSNQPVQCPSPWTQAPAPFGLVCAELSDGSATWVRNCYQDK